MTTRTLTGTYTSSFSTVYALKPNYNRLVIAASAEVYGVGVGAIVANDAAIANYAIVKATGYAVGVYLTSGSVTNGSATNKTALIAGGGYAVKGSGSPIFVTNFGTIEGLVNPSGLPGAGIDLQDGGTVTNGSAADTTALIAGDVGVKFSTVTNFGTINGGADGGVILDTSGEVTNGSTADHAAVIRGYNGVADSGFPATVTNFGTIDATVGKALLFDNASDRLIVEAGSSLVGFAGGDGTLELAGGSDTITNLGYGTLSGGASAVRLTFASYTVDAGASLTIAGTSTLFGTLAVDDGSATVTGPLTILGAISSPKGAGVTLPAGGSVTNGSASDTAASISSYLPGVDATGAAATIGNFGAISSSKGAGVTLAAGGRVTNGSASDTTASISGYLSGVDATGAAATIGNFGAIACTGRYGDGVELSPGGRVTNGSATDSSASITGYFGVSATGSAGSAGVTVTNFGTIDGTDRTAVSFTSASDRLIVEAGSALIGAAAAAGGALELAGGSETVTGLGASGAMTGGASGSFYGFGSYLVDAKAVLTLTGTNSLTTGQSLTVAGSLINTGSLQPTSRYDNGVDLNPGGRVTNGSATDSTASILGYIGVSATGPAGSAGVTVTNFGTIDGTDRIAVGFTSASDRLIVEAGSALVGAAAGAGGALELAGGSETVTGLGASGAMTGGASGSFYGFGSYLVDAGAVLTLTGTNSLTAAGQSLSVAGSLINTGALQATSRYGNGVDLSPGGRVTNGSTTDSTASITGYFGVSATGSAGSAGVTVTNFGTIDGTDRTSVSFRSASDRLIVEAGSALVGAAAGDGGTLELAGGSDRITGLGGNGALTGGASGSFYGFGSYLVDAGTVLTLTGTNSLTTGQSLTVAGSLINTGAFNTAGGAVTLSAGGRLTNGSASDITALIAGGVTTSAASASITNFATISGSGGAAVTLGNATDILNAEAGSTFVGAVDALGGAVNVVSGPADFAGGVVTSGKIEGGGLLLLSGGTSAFSAGASLSVASIDVTGVGTQVDVTSNLTDAKLWIQNAGTLSVGAGDVMDFTAAGDTFAGSLAGAGTVEVQSGSDSLNGTTLTAANVIISAAATVTLAGAIDNTSNVSSSTANLIVAAGGASLTGVGTLTLSNSAANRIYGATSSATLTNVDNRIVGAGLLGNGDMTLVNEAAGLINGNDSQALIIDTGANTFVNDGFIEATGAGGVTVKSAVTGTGSAQVTAGTLFFASSFSENVAFGAAGVLKLADSKTYTGSISGFSKSGHTSLDLLDIGFVSSTEATFSGTSSGGVLTVTDGTNTAHIRLVGNYTASTFVASSDGHGGTIVIDHPNVPAGPSRTQVAPPHQFIAAMAGMGAGGAGAGPVAGEAHAEAWRQMLSTPGLARAA